MITVVNAIYMICLPHSETKKQLYKPNQITEYNGGGLLIMRIFQSVSHSTHKNGFSVMVISQSLS